MNGSPDDIALAAVPHCVSFSCHGGHVRRTLSDWRRLVLDGVPEGQRNSSVASLAGHVLSHQVDPEVTLQLLLAWNRIRCRPLLDDSK
jgi:hypothetical protein